MKQVELIEKRKPREKYFLQKDGTIRAEIYDTDVHYLKNGRYEEIDNSLVKKNGSLVNKNNDYLVEFKEDFKDSLMKMSKDGYYIDFKIKGLKDLSLKQTKRVLSYKMNNCISNDITDDISIEYQTLSNKVKETIVLKNANHSKFSFELDTNIDLKEENGEIIALDEDANTIFKIEKPYMIDSNNIVNENVHYLLNKYKDAFILDLVLDDEWLQDSTRKFPIYIDPTISNQGQNIILQDTYIYPGDDNDVRYNKAYLKAGVERINGQDRINRTLIKFNLPKIGTGSEIISAYLDLVGYPTTTSYPSDRTATIHCITQDWDESTANWITMNDKYDSKVESLYYGHRSTIDGSTIIPAYNYYSGDITSIVKKWYRDTPNYGLMIKSIKETYVDDDFPAFYSKDNNLTSNNPKPVFQLVYRNHNGLESYLDYKELSYTDGSMYVNTYNGNLVSIFNIGQIVGSKLPCELDLIYNTNDVVLQNNTIYGNGCKLNFNQTLKEVTVSDTSYLEYNDENGTIHYFYEDENVNGKYIDEDGLSLTIQKDANNCVMTDKNNNIMTFTKYNNIYYLNVIEDTNQNILTIEFDNTDYNKISRIYDSSNNQISLTYSNEQIEITSSDASVYLNYSNNNLSSILTPNGTTSFSYNANGLISSVTDITGMKNNYEYYTNLPYRLKKITQYGLNNEEGQSFELNYGFDTTSIIDHKDRVTNLIYNSSGNLVTSNSLNSSEDLNGAYSIVQEYDHQQQNKIINVNSPVKYIKNYLKNTSFETDTEYFTIDSTNILKSYDSNNCVSGTRSLKLETLSINQSIEQIINVPKGAHYTFSGYFISNYPIKISLSYTDINNDEILNETIIPSSSDFIREDVSIYYDESATNNLKIKISIPNISTVYIDDIQLEEGEVANHYNIIENSDFSEGYNDWTSTSWVYDNSDTPPTDFLEIANFNNNHNKALKIKMNPLYGTRISKTLPIKGKEGDLYTISFWYKNEGYAADGGTVGNSVSIYFKPVGHDAEYCIMTSEPFNPNNGIWQYFTYRDRAREDFESITINFLQGREANNLYITNVSFYKDVTSGDYGYDSNGNVVSIENQSKEKSVFKYDNNNQLLNASSPIGKNFKYEYDNDKRRLLNAISSSGVANQIKYDSNGKPISIRISKRKTNIIDGNNFRIRSKGTEKYIKARFRNLVVETDPCSNTIWTFTHINDGYKISHSLYPNYSISLVDNTIMLSPQNSNNLFELEENDNGSYYLKTLVPAENGNLMRYLKVNDNLLELATLVDDDSTFEFYIEETDSKFIENSATYSSDGRFVTSITDSSFNTTIYDTNSSTGLVNYKINPKGVQTDYTYNEKNQITSITTNDKEVNYEYSNNRINKITLGNKEYNILYDNFLNISKIKIGNKITLLENTYGLFNDNLQSVRYGNNQTISYQYDEFDRINRITKSDNVYNYKYDNNGKIAKVISNNNLVKANYDKSGRLYRYKDNNLRIGYTYDSDNNVTNVIYKTNNQENEVSNIYNADGILTQSLFENQAINYTYDGLNRIINKNINNNYSIQCDYVSYGNRTTILPKSINNNNDIFEYKYDKMDNIVEIYHNNTIQKKYNYNVYNELLEEENYDLNTKVTYTYDLFGNILSKQTINLTTSELISADSYQYSQGDWKDLLLGYNNLNITYDAIGNPISIGNNIQMLWINGHELNSYSDISNNLIVSYEYNDKGIRNSKTVNNVKTSYYLEGNDIVYEKTGDNTIYYIRDNDGLIGLKYNNNIYYYIKNVQGDILGILDNNLNQVVSYQYDSWGKIINFTDTSVDGIGEINPFRYRSYYYDKETNLYYLNYRYYNPDWCRFISADSFIGATGDHNGYNLYTYVSNNPINNADFSGQSLKGVIKSIKKTVKKVSKAVKSITKKVASTVKKTTKTVINTVVSVVKTVANSKKSFVVEGQIGFGIGGKVGQGIIKTEAEASKGFGWGYRSDTGSYEFTSNSIGATTEVFGNKDLEFGLGAELRNYDKYTNPMIMPWEVWDSENTSKEVTFGFSKKNYTGEGSRDFSSKNDTIFIGIDLSGYLAIGGGVKIGFELDP